MSCRPLVLAGLLLASASFAPASGQVAFDFISFDQAQLDPTAGLAFVKRWGMLVNTGSVPLSLEQDWEGGLWLAESSEPIGAFFFEILNPFGGDFIVQPGEAIGDTHPLLLAELLPGETLVGPGPGTLIGNLQMNEPFPATDFDLEMRIQVGDQQLTTGTHVQLASLGGPIFEGTSAVRASSQAAPQPVESYGSNCGSGVELSTYGVNFGSGPPHIAYLSNMPALGNWAFGLEIEGPGVNSPFVLLLDLAPGSYPFKGCRLWVGLTPVMLMIPGQLTFFDETVPLSIPDDPLLLGIDLYFQAVLTGSFQMSKGLRVTLVD